MRAAAALLLLLAAAACRQQPSFDERYKDTANEIQDRAANLDAQLNTAEPTNDQST